MRPIPLFNAILRSVMNANGNRIVNVGEPTEDNDAATKKYVREHTGDPSDYPTVRQNAATGAAHAADTGNPHATTAEQVGAYTKGEVDEKITQNAAHYLTAKVGGAFVQFATYTALAAAKDAHTDENPQFWYGDDPHTPDKNDYCIVLDDETHSHATTRYMFVGEWPDGLFRYQYTVNETALTQAQWDALNSGATKEKIDAISGKLDKTEGVLEPGSFGLANGSGVEGFFVRKDVGIYIGTPTGIIEIPGGTMGGTMAVTSDIPDVIDPATATTTGKAADAYETGKKLAEKVDVLPTRYVTTNGKNGLRVEAYKDKNGEWKCDTFNLPEGFVGPIYNPSDFTEAKILFEFRGYRRGLYFFGEESYYDKQLIWDNDAPCGQFFEGGNAITEIIRKTGFIDNLTDRSAKVALFSDTVITERITMLAEAAIMDKAMPTEGAVEGSVAARIVALEAGGGGGDMTFVLKYNSEKDVIYFDDGVKA